MNFRNFVIFLSKGKGTIYVLEKVIKRKEMMESLTMDPYTLNMPGIPATECNCNKVKIIC